MVQATVPSELSLLLSTEDPSDAGDIRVIKGAISVLNDCDSSGGWSSITGGTVSLTPLNPYEGDGAIKHTQYRSTVADSTAVLKYANPTTSWDFNGYKYLSLFIKPILAASNFKISFGESTYSEQVSAGSNLTVGAYSQKVFDLSSVTSNSMNAVTRIAVVCDVSRGSTIFPSVFDVDYITLDPGAGEVKFFDGDRVGILSPKVLHGLYTGASSAQTVYLSATSDANAASRKGTPVSIEIIRDAGTNLCVWKQNISTGFSLIVGVGVSSDCITSVSDGSFTVGRNSIVNSSSQGLHLFTALYED